MLRMQKCLAKFIYTFDKHLISLSIMIARYEIIRILYFKIFKQNILKFISKSKFRFYSE
jgi:hypothetical protein